jgi:hypothetical protein
MTATKIFEINATYKTYETGTVVKVLSRSMNSLTIQLASGETLQKRFKLNDDGVEFLQLSKWETVYADDPNEEPQDEEPQDVSNFQFTITALESVLFTVTVNNDVIIEVKPMADDAVIAAFLGQHNISDDNDMSMFTPYLESALKIKDSDGLMISIDRKYGNGGSRIATVEVIQSLIGRKVIFQRKHHATVIEEFKATDESELEYGLHWIKIRLDNGKITSLAKDAKTLQYL